MNPNRSIPDCTVIPELPYSNIHEAANWLVRAFGFRRRLIIGSHRIQMTVDGGGALVVVEGNGKSCVLVRVPDAKAHHERARREGAAIVSPPTDYPFGERQYTVLDPGGHSWTFSQSIADVDPREWGGELA